MPLAKRPGAYYLAALRPHITSEGSKKKVLDRPTRRSNVYYGAIPGGVPFAFTWSLDPGEIDISEKTKSPPLISWELSFARRRVFWGSDRANTQAGTALINEISKSEAIVAAILNDDPSTNPIQEVQTFISALHTKIDTNTFVFPPGDDLKTYIKSL